ncbi:membrane metalloprotease [Seonamhaeicola algicola]|uniref:Membrane metalloprotease n=1 Tax=Seonamhaeicola algicola TaxID=1719036 RepID=A0A5C7APK3_9FLAO|nr:membrane metalloprotease [Seonamhaeicola algicola]TXE09894.1 membrane metalloprotease [Seonamhaeicola algicola]
MKLKLITLLAFTLIVFGCTKDDDAESTNTNNGVNKNLNRQETGSSANAILSSNTFKSLVIELVFIEGFEPTQTAINNLVSFINNTSNKPNGITVQKRAIPATGKDTYTINEIADIERQQRQLYNTDTQIAIWALFVNGKSSNDSNNTVTLGSAYWNTSFVIYQETIENLSNGPFEPERTLLETTVITHEFGHLLGLTNAGTDMQNDHEDEEHPRHCNEQDCLMYWAAESGASISNMSNMNTAPQLDAQCLADLKANGGK